MGDKVALSLLQMRTQVKLFHWQTTSYAEHKALDALDAQLIELNDKWVESYQGNENTRVSCGKEAALRLVDWSAGAPHRFLKDRVEFLRTQREELWEDQNHEYLANIMDEIIAALGQALFLLTLI